MPMMTFEELNIALDAWIAAGEVYNADFQHTKTYEAGRTLEAEIKAATDAHYLSLPHEQRPHNGPANTLYWSFGGMSIMSFPSKKLITAVGAMPAGDAYGDAIAEIVARWTPVAEKFKTLKPMIVKGRKPSTTPRVTPERTFENTGTCACCGKNVKMEHGKLVNHGFTIRHGFQEGKCPGVGCDPIEVSNEGLLKFGNMLIDELSQKNSAIMTIATTLSTNLESEIRTKLATVYLQEQRMVVRIQSDIDNNNTRVMSWTPSSLPGEDKKAA